MFQLTDTAMKDIERRWNLGVDMEKECLGSKEEEIIWFALRWRDGERSEAEKVVEEYEHGSARSVQTSTRRAELQKQIGKFM